MTQLRYVFNYKFLMPIVADKGGWKHIQAAESGVNIRESIYLVTYL